MSDLPFDRPDESPLRDETVVFTGKLWSFGRKDARALVESLGGTCDDDVTIRTTLLVVGAGTYPDGAPDLSLLLDDNSTQNQKLRRVAQINAEQPGRIRVLSEDEFCRVAGQPAVAERRTQHYGVRDILAMYPALRARSPALPGEVGLHQAGVSQQRRHLLRLLRSHDAPPPVRRAAAGRVVQRGAARSAGVTHRPAGLRLPARRAAGPNHRAEAANRATDRSAPGIADRRRRRSATCRPPNATS